MRWRARAADWLARVALVCACQVGCGGDDRGPDAPGEGQAQSGRGGNGGSGGGGGGGNGGNGGNGGESAGGTIGSAAGTGGTAGGAGAQASNAGRGGSDAGDAQPDAATIDPDAGAMPSSCGVCTEYADPIESGRVEPAALSALSGLSWSRSQPEVLYAHNDHDRPVVYALDLQGQLHATIELVDAPAEDIEDIAVGACGAAAGGADSCVYLGDIGDNPAARDEYAILRFVEPSIPGEPGSTAIALPFERFAFTYEDGSHNAEGLMVAPDGNVYIVTKLAAGSGGPVGATGVSSVYRLAAPLVSGSVATAVKVATLPIPAASDLAASAAAAHPCEPAFLVRTYDRVYELRAAAGEPFEAALTADPVVVAMPDEPQSEGIDYRPDGHGFASSGEGAGAPIMLTDCR